MVTVLTLEIPLTFRAEYLIGGKKAAIFNGYRQPVKRNTLVEKDTPINVNLDLGDALDDDCPAKPSVKPAPPKNPDSGFDLSDAFDLDKKKPSGGGFDLSDAFGPDTETKKPVIPPKDRGTGGGTFDDKDLVDVNEGGEYNPDGGRSGGGGTEQPQGGAMAAIISSVGVALLGAASSYFAYQKKKLCFKMQGDFPRCSEERYKNQTEMAEAQAFVTLATTDAYSMGCIVVGKSLRRHGTSRKLVVMVSPNVSRAARLALEDVFDEVVMVDVLDSGDKAHLTLLRRPELGVTFTKLHCWTLTQYSKCVFLDADTLVLCNVDELFEYEELSAAPDPGWPDCFNSGVFVFRPSLNTHTQILEHAAQHGSFDGGDQGVLNTFFNDWAVKDIRKHLPFVYNLTSAAVYTYLPAFQQYGHHAKIVHFLGGTKPWHLSYDPQAVNESSLWDSSNNFQQFIQLWWVEYYSKRQLEDKKDDKNEDHPVEQLVSPQTHLTPSQSQKSSTEAHHREMITPSPPLQDPALDSLTISSSEKPEESAAAETEEDDLEHRRMWEEGRADYMGKDAFDNIMRKLDLFLD
ncbi:glycogenin-1-like isoform X1 [Labeo rohita]|uniref:glycogenin glucosyltransferase n=1 Tax=Labeo rohita TaxID=84645 RepID=A0A498L8S4_LABRO|nr:glycogenin-1-like isoform X1 [Labeo rohita]